MDFAEWMNREGLSKHTIDSYVDALRGPLSEWAMAAQLIDVPLLSLSDGAIFELVARDIRKLKEFTSRSAKRHSRYGAALSAYVRYLRHFQPPSIDTELDAIRADDSLDSTTKRRLIDARLGQGKFRTALLEYWGGCAVTGFAAQETMLVASHIKPWAKSSNAERTDHFNGLLLLPNIDRAFDNGLISFDEDGVILISRSFINPRFFGINRDMKIKKLTANHLPYLAHHRTHEFKERL